MNLLKLQCGHGSGAVENTQNGGRATVEHTMLQCGHGSGAVENTPSVVSPARLSERFNAATAQEPWRTSPMSDSSVRRSVSFNAATAQEPWRTQSKGEPQSNVPPLQCGHGSGAVENRHPGAAGAGRRSASMRPRLRS